MALYMLQFTYTPEAWAALSKNPVDRTGPISALAEKVGGRLLTLYYCFGEYDGVVTFEAPDDKAAATISVAAGIPGHLKMTKTTKLLSTQDALEVMRQAGSMSYQAPSSGN